MTTTERSMTVRQLQSHYSNQVRNLGRDSAEAKQAERAFWTASLCELLANTIAEHPLDDDQRERIAHVALTTPGGTVRD